MNDHIDMNPVFDADSKSVARPRDHDLVFPQLNVFAVSFRDDDLLNVIVGQRCIAVFARDVIQCILELVVVEIRGDHIPGDVKTADDDQYPN